MMRDSTGLVEGTAHAATITQAYQDLGESPYRRVIARRGQLMRFGEKDG